MALEQCLYVDYDKESFSWPWVRYQWGISALCDITKGSFSNCRTVQNGLWTLFNIGRFKFAQVLSLSFSPPLFIYMYACIALHIWPYYKCVCIHSEFAVWFFWSFTAQAGAHEPRDWDKKCHTTASNWCLEEKKKKSQQRCLWPTINHLITNHKWAHTLLSLGGGFLWQTNSPCQHETAQLSPTVTLAFRSFVSSQNTEGKTSAAHTAQARTVWPLAPGHN